jgi:Ca2+-transporting ATPase
MESPPPAAWHAITAEEAAHTLGVTVATGLSKAEVKRRQAESGPNKVSARRGTPAWLKFLQQFHQPLVYVMLVAVGVTSFLGEWVDAGVIGAIVVVNAIVGFLQETKAETAIEALAKMVVTEATVRREGKKERVPSESLVPGEVVLLQSGDRVPAEMRLIEIRSLQVDESALTGESLPVAKQLDVLPEGT